MLDRFSDGDRLNNQGNNPDGTTNAANLEQAPEAEWRKYLGGDIQGLINKLDYLKDIGIRAIWVTPMVDNIDATGQEGAYHGYHARDWYRIDEHFGDWELLRTLKSELTKRDIKLVVDFAVNHSNPANAYEFGAVLVDGVPLARVNEPGAGEYFSLQGNISDYGDQQQVLHHDLHGLADLKQGEGGTAASFNSPADQMLIGAARKWLEVADAFRIDAIRHVSADFIVRFSAAAQDHFHRLHGQDQDLYIFGEWFGAGSANHEAMRFVSEKRGSELLDFELQGAVEKVLAEHDDMHSLARVLENRPAAWQGREKYQLLFLDNHDAPRTKTFLCSNQTIPRCWNGEARGPGFPEELANRRIDLGLAIIFSAPGIPSVYYGTEEYLGQQVRDSTGARGGDPFNREPMKFSSLNTPAKEIIRTLSTLRRESPALQLGEYRTLYETSEILIFERAALSEKVIICINRNGENSIEFKPYLPDGQYKKLLGGTDPLVVEGGLARISLAPNSVTVIRS